MIVFEFATAEHTTENRLAHIEDLISSGQYEQAIQSSDELIQLGLRAIRYLQTYDWLFLRTLITLGYLGWIAFAFTTAVDAYMLGGRIDASRTTGSIVAFASLLVALYSFLFVRSSPPQYYAYAFFPVMFWEEVFARREALIQGCDKLFAKFGKTDTTKLMLNILTYAALLEVMVQSYYHRHVYTICYILFAAWPLYYGTDFVSKNWILCSTWALSCTSMSIFTLLPANKVEDANLIQLGGCSACKNGTTSDATRVIQPTTWVPNGKPCLACRDVTLDRVTAIARATRPTWAPRTVREM
jgi:GPI ethanolamine phosphate transferase 1